MFFKSLFGPATVAIGAAELADRLAAGETPVIIDVREPAEYAGGHIPGSRNIPLGQVAARVSELPASGPVYLICRSGGRSGQAARALSGHGFTPINVRGGMLSYPGPVN